jgi:hypothetical protein
LAHLARLFGRRQQIVKLHRVSKDIAELNAKAEAQLVTVTTPRGFNSAGRVGSDQAQIAIDFVENELVCF